MNDQAGRLPPRIAIIGGGLSGLVAAFELAQMVQQQVVPEQGGERSTIDLYEATDRIGGVFGTIKKEGYQLETGADMFITNKPEGIELVKRLGLESRLINTDPKYRGSLILHRGQPVPTPDGLELMLPRKFWPFVTTPLLSPLGKLRGLCEYFVSRRTKPGEALQDETLSSFVKRRLGTEIFDRIVQPMVGGIYTADPDKLSLLATLPRFLEWERDAGSLLAESLRQRRQSTRSTGSPRESAATGARYGMFVSFQEGMSELHRALYDQSQHLVNYQFNSQVTSLTKYEAGYQLEINQERRENYTAIILAVPVHVAARLTVNISAELSRSLGSIECASAAIVVTGHQITDFKHPMNSFGLVIPAIEKRKILAVSITSRKFPQRAPEGCLQLRTFIGGALQQELLKLSDDELTQIVAKELTEIFGMQAPPHLVYVQRWNQAMPQYHLGHLEKVKQLELAAAQCPQLGIATNALHGVGIPDVIATAQSAVKSILKEVNQHHQLHHSNT